MDAGGSIFVVNDRVSRFTQQSKGSVLVEVVQVPKFAANVHHWTASQDHLGIHVQRNMKYKLVGMLSEASEEAKRIFDMFKDIHGNSQVVLFTAFEQASVKELQ